MDEKDFSILETLSETRSVTKAAERLYMTQSALSKRIKAIELDLGAAVLLRSRRGVTFTPAGEQVLAHSRAAARELAAMRRDIGACEDEVAGTLRACFSINYALCDLPDVLDAYHTAYPNVHLDVRTGNSRDLYTRMLRGDFDIAVLRGEFGWDGPKRLLAEERVYAAVPASHEGEPLEGYPYISHETDSGHSQQVARWLHENGLGDATSVIQVNSLTTCAAMVERGLGWALLPQIALKGFTGSAEPCHFADGTPFLRRMYLMWQRDAERLPQVMALRELLQRRRGD